MTQTTCTQLCWRDCCILLLHCQVEGSHFIWISLNIATPLVTVSKDSPTSMRNDSSEKVHMHMQYLNTCLPLLRTPPLNTHLVPVLRVHIEGVHQVTCHLIVTCLGCPVQHGVGVLCLLVDSFPKHRHQGIDHLNVPAYCSKVHGIEAILHWETKHRSRGHCMYNHNILVQKIIT